MAAVCLHLGHGCLCLFRFPVALVDEGGDRGRIGKGQHPGVVPAKKALVHHAGKDGGEQIHKARQKVFAGQGPGPVVPKLLNEFL